ncbi:MAG: ATP-binding protein [Methylococcaceae bacterium]
MNLFTETLAEYLKKEWARVMAASDGVKEARFIVESLDPYSTFKLFSSLEAYRLESLEHGHLECHFRVAKNLWTAWCQRESEVTLKKAMAECGGISENGELKWIDLDDRLTWYRNLTLPENKDGLVVVLLGFNHASDQGGLANFHLVDENRLWNELGQGFNPWIDTINQRLSLDATELQIERFDGLLHQLFKVRPRRLVRLAEFFEREVFSHKDNFDSMDEVIECCYKTLPFWDIPPLLNVKNTKKHANLIKEAEVFISHQRFTSTTEQDKAWKKIEKKLADSDAEFEIPETLSAQTLYPDIKAFSDTLYEFIFKANAEAKARLMQTDLVPILAILKLPTDAKKPSRDKIQRLSGFSLEVMLQAIWNTLLEFEAQNGRGALADSIKKIEVVVDRFSHDLDADLDEGIDVKSLAGELLTGCLGGLAELFNQIDLRMSSDSDQTFHWREQWSHLDPVPISLNMELVTYGTSRARPNVCFRVVIVADEEIKSFKSRVFQWSFGPTHPERVRFFCARTVLEQWEPFVSNGVRMLPAFQMPAVVMTALYFASDEDEANRLVSQALSQMQIINLAADINANNVDQLIWDDLRDLSTVYRNWLQCFMGQGYYYAMSEFFLALQATYEKLAKSVLNKNITGSEELLRRFYKAFLLVDERMNPNDDYLRSAVAWGISPPVLELTHGRARFLCDSFPEVVGEHLVTRNGKSIFNRLLNLVEIHRPLAALVVDDNKNLSAKIKSFGLLHYLGTPPSTEKSLAVQTLLRDEEGDDEDDISDDVRWTEESEVVVRVLRDYLSLYPFAEDGLRILAVHVEELVTILSGVDRFLRDYLKCSPSDWPPFYCELMVYSTSSSPLAVESRLTAWRDKVTEAYREQGRPIILSVAHHYAPSQKKMVALLNKEARLYDIAFLFRFLAGELTGEAESALPFEYDFNDSNISQFPICEYPRPIQEGTKFRRQSLLSNRRLRIQTYHADMSARLRHPQNPEDEHLIFGHINYEPWQEVVETMHGKAQWVACIDPFVDKHLLASSDTNGQRKIVGFTSGLGAYGELNLSISTEQDTLTQLTDMVKNHLAGLLPFQQGDDFEMMAVNVVKEAEEIIGLSSLRAVVGQGEKIREVIGFAAVARLLGMPTGVEMVQLLPIDSLLHWFVGSDVVHRPDLLQLSLVMRENDIPLIHAVLIECKFAQQNSTHLIKARDQIQDGLSHLTQLFAPNRSDIRRVSFDRRYWWAQLQRSITSRSIISKSEQHRKKLGVALEQLAEGYYEINWQAAIFTFWTDNPSSDVTLEKITLPPNVVLPPLEIPDNFTICHVAMGYQGVVSLFTGKSDIIKKVELPGKPISVRPKFKLSSESTTAPTKLNEEATEESQETIGKVNPPVSQQIESETLIVLPVTEIVEVPVIDDHVIDLPKPEVKVAIEVISPSKSTFSSIPEKLLIGNKSNGEPVYWHYGHPQLPNRHMLLFGASGSGKTYGIQCLLAEMAKEGMRSLIIDYTDGFLPLQVEQRFRDVAKPQNHFVITDKLPLNPFRRQLQIIDPSIPAIEENPYQVASRITSIFTSVFNTMGDQQSSALVRTLEAGIEEDPNFSLNGVLIRLREDSQYGESLANKLEPFIKSQPFREGADSAWEQMLTSSNQWVHVLQLKGVAREIQKLVTEFALWDLYDYACNTGSKNRPIPVVLDEIQNLDHRSDSPIDKMLREGRKFGLSMMLATQTTSQFDQEQRDRLFQAGHKLFFKPANTEINRFADLLSVATPGVSKAEWGERLAKLQKGQCWSLGPVLTSSGALQDKPILVSVTSLEERDFGS